MTGIAKINERGLELRDMSDLTNAVQMIVCSEVCPKAYRNKPKDAIIAILAGRQVGWGLIQSLQYIAVINGMPSMYGDGPSGLAHGAGKVDWIREWWEINGEKVPEPNFATLAEYPESLTACWQTKRKDNSEPSKVSRFSVMDAKVARLWEKRGAKGPSAWCTYPKRMLVLRARGWGLRDNYSDALQGIIQAEEWEDMISQPRELDPLEAAAKETEDVVDAETTETTEENPQPTDIFETKEYKELVEEHKKKFPTKNRDDFIRWCENEIKADMKEPDAWNKARITKCRLALKAIPPDAGMKEKT